VKELMSLGIAGLSTNKKYHCKFCYSAVCENCSSSRVEHLETAKPERICEHCYLRYFEDTLKTGIQAELDEARSKLKASKAEYAKEAALAEQERSQAKQLEAKLLEMEGDAEKRFTGMRQSLQKHQKECDEIVRATEKLKDEFTTASAEFANEDRRRSETRQRLETLTGSVDEQRGLLATRRTSLAHSQDENMHLRHLIDEKVGSLTLTDQKRMIQEKQRAIQKLQRDKADLAKEIVGLKDEIESADQTLSLKETAIVELKVELSENAGSKTRVHSSHWDELQKLKQKVLLLKNENEALRTHHLESKGSDLRKELLTQQEGNATKIRKPFRHSLEQGTPGPLEAKKCNCRVF
jgi:predicted  nucleic acid-binding Zn-ribbon protein